MSFTPEGASPELVAVRHRTYFGAGKHRICECKNRKTGLRCKNVAVTGSKACRFHGGTSVRNRKNKTIGLGCMPDRVYHASLAFSEHLNAIVAEVEPSRVAEAMKKELPGARGAALHALVNSKKTEE